MVQKEKMMLSRAMDAYEYKPFLASLFVHKHGGKK
jgi:hypothetical protein